MDVKIRSAILKSGTLRVNGNRVLNVFTTVIQMTNTITQQETHGVCPRMAGIATEFLYCRFYHVA